jgi:hypothetical protein
MQQQQIENWLRQIGTQPVSVAAAAGNEWRLQFTFPPGSQQTLSCFAPQNPAGATVIAVNYPLSPAEAAFDSLSTAAKNAFLLELRATLTRDHLFHDISPGASPQSCPRTFGVFDVRFDDGLTLDSFARSVMTVNNTGLAANLCCAKHLGAALQSPTAAPKRQ